MGVVSINSTESAGADDITTGDSHRRIGPHGLLSIFSVMLLPFLVAGCGMDWSGLFDRKTDSEILTVYSGRSEELIRPLIESYRERTGVDVQVRYGTTSEMAATILEEGPNSPADVFFAQDAGALGALTRDDRLNTLPDEILELVEPQFRSPTGYWVGVSGRARVVVYNPDSLSPEDLPDTIAGFCKPEWRGRVGWAPPNGSFQSFVTAIRVMRGEEAAREWLSCIKSNRVRSYARNTPIILAVASGEIDAGFTNHYYVHQLMRERGEQFRARNHFMTDGSLINAAGLGIIDTTNNRSEAERFLRFMLGREAQEYFTSKTFEYPLAKGIQTDPALPPLRDLSTPDIDLTDLDDLEGTLRLLMELYIL